MFGRTVCALTLITTVAVAAQQGDRAKPERAFKDALPGDTMMFVTMPNIPRSLDEMSEMPLLRMWREGEVQDFFAEALKMLAAEREKMFEQGRKMHEAGQLAFDPDQLKNLKLESLSFALTDLSVHATESGPPEFKLGMVGHASFGDSAALWRDLLETLLEMGLAQAPDGMVERSKTTVGELEIHTLNSPQNTTSMSLNWAFTGDGMLVSTTPEELARTVQSLHGDGGKLTGTTNYRRVAGNLDAQGAEAEVFVQPGRFVEFLIGALKVASKDPNFPPQLSPDGIARALDAFGVNALKAMGSTSTYAGQQCVNRSYMLAPAPERRGFFADANKELDLSFLKWVPKDAVGVSAYTFDIMSIYDALVGSVKAYDEEMADMVLGQLATAEEQVGLKIKEDLFGAFGDFMVTWSMPIAAFGTPPETAFLVKIKDEERLLKTIQTIAKMSEGAFEIDEIDRRGIKAYQLRVNFDSSMMMFNPFDMFTPTLAFKDGYMVAALSTGDIKRAFNRMDREDNPEGDIRTNPDFAKVFAKLPKQGMTSMAYTDWRSQFEGLYQFATSVVAWIPMDKSIPLDVFMLPDSSTLTEHLSPSISWSSADGNGYQTTTVSPWGPETEALFACIVAVGVGVVASMMPF